MLTGKEIENQIKANKIKVEDYSPKNLGPNSYDLRLGEGLAMVIPNAMDMFGNEYIDTRLPSKVEERHFCQVAGGAYFDLLPGRVYLAHTQELIGSDQFVAVIHGRSSVARHGTMTHLTAGFCDLGWYGQVVLELANLTGWLMRFWVGDRICQAEFDPVQGEVTLYNSDYQGQLGIKPAKGIGDR